AAPATPAAGVATGERSASGASPSCIASSMKKRPAARARAPRAAPDQEARPAVPGRAARPDRRLTTAAVPAMGTAATHVRDTTMAAVKTVLVVDDEPKIVQLARDYLEHAGFVVLTAADGRSALQQVRSRRPDLIVLDL